jgi:hypothetical protein
MEEDDIAPNVRVSDRNGSTGNRYKEVEGAADSKTVLAPLMLFQAHGWTPVKVC